MTLKRIMRIALVSALWMLPTALWAQSTGSIAGLVTDTSGAVVPGVTVEASSPALIERARSVVTDAAGRYEIVALPTGTYGVAFSLTGFTTVRRENIQLPTGFTATVNAQMTIGSLTETLTVSGAIPMVDVGNVRTQNVLTHDVLEALPTNKSMQGFASVTPGMIATTLYGGPYDVGGNLTDTYGSVGIYGLHASDTKSLMNGMTFNSMVANNGGSDKQYFVNTADVQEVVLETSGLNAERETGGIQLNYVSKSGGNSFSENFSTAYTSTSLQVNNLTDAIRARGVTSPKDVKKIYDVGGGFGGPIKKDKLWFFTAHRYWGNQQWALVDYNATQGTPVYTPDPARRGYVNYYNIDDTVRLTWQVASKHKFTVSESKQHNCNCHLRVDLPGYAPEANVDYTYFGINLLQGTWTYPASSRLLFEGGLTFLRNHSFPRLPPDAPGLTSDSIALIELSTNFNYNAPALGLSQAGYSGAANYSQQNQHMTVSYVTGSHSFKAGVSTQQGVNRWSGTTINGSVYYNFLKGVPNSITEWASPQQVENRTRLNLGAFVQDKWAIHRLSLNYGLRFDYFNAYVPAQTRPGGFFVPSLSFSEIDHVGDFKDITPRLGAAYDLVGNGKTAIKASVGRYVASLGAGFANNQNPASQIVLSTARTWSITPAEIAQMNGTQTIPTPNCNLLNPAANGECGPINNSAFGTVRPATTWAPDVLGGWGNRQYNWTASAGVQNEIRSGFSVNASYYRTWFGNFTTTHNQFVTPTDYDPYCVTAPVDSRMPNGGGYQICDLGDVKPALFGKVNNIVQKSSRFGHQSEVYNGVDLTTNIRFGRGGFITGGLNTGRTETHCVVADAPQQFCDVVPPFWLPQVKLSASYPLPWYGVLVSGVFQSVAGLPIGTGTTTIPGAVGAATFVATNAQIAPSLGRNLSACGAVTVGCVATATVTLLPPYTNFEPRANQIDLRFAKSIRIGAVRILPGVDVYNILNAIDVGAQTLRYGPLYQVPSDLKGGRLLKFGAQVNF
jgi:hypothetical protein